jgi:hypothetical protein
MPGTVTGIGLESVTARCAWYQLEGWEGFLEFWHLYNTDSRINDLHGVHIYDKLKPLKMME